MTRRKLISAFISLLSFSLLWAVAVPAQAQQRKKVIEQQKDTIPLFRGIGVQVDLGSAVQRMVSDYGQYEAAVKVNLKDRYFPIVELGIGSADKTDDGTRLHYKTSAPYGRIGCDFNFLRNKHDIYRAYGGVRYAYSSFKYDVDGGNLHDPVWGGSAPLDVHDVKATYHWLEFVFATEAKIFGPVRLGWSLRYRRRLAQSHGEIGEPWYIPGFGRKGNQRIGAEFNVGIEL